MSSWQRWNQGAAAAAAIGALLLGGRALHAADDLLPPEQAFKFSARMVDANSVEVRYRIANGYYMYREKFHFAAQPSSVALGEPQYPAGKIKEDEFFGRVETYRDEVAIRVPLKAGAPDFTLEASSQGCADAGICYTPLKQRAALTLAAAESSATSDASSSDSSGVLSKLRAMARGGSDKQDDFLPVEKAFKVDVRVKDERTLIADFVPVETYYLYRDKIQFAVPKGGPVAIAKVDLPRGEKKSDPNFGETEVFHRPFQAVVHLDRTAAASASKLIVDTGYQGCSEKGLCYPPTQRRFELSLAALTAQNGKSPGALGDGRLESPLAVTPELSSTSTAPAPVKTVMPTPENESSKLAQIFESRNVFVIVAAFFVLGLGLAFTPCVLPMVPILSGIIVGQGPDITRKRALSLALIYSLGMSITYALAGIGAAMSGQLLSNALQNKWVLGAFSALMVLLALSMFGFYELQMPSAIQSRLSNASNRMKGGTFWGVFVMGVLSALIVGPCVAGPLVAILVYISKTQDMLIGGSALFSMAWGMDIPLIAVGVSAGALLPRAGAWMQTVRNFFGVMLLALAIWIVSPVLSATVHMLLWAVLLIVSAIYLHAIDALPANSSGFRKLWKGVGVLALLTGVALLIGALSGARDILQPLAGLHGGAAIDAKGEGIKFERVRSVAELDNRLAQSKGRPVMLDFYADWCVACKEMERFTFSHPEIKQRLDRMVLLQADVTANSTEDSALLKRYGLYGPPGILFFGEGQELADLRVIGFQPADRFKQSLDAVLTSL